MTLRTIVAGLLRNRDEILSRLAIIDSVGFFESSDFRKGDKKNQSSAESKKVSCLTPLPPTHQLATVQRSRGDQVVGLGPPEDVGVPPERTRSDLLREGFQRQWGRHPRNS